MNSLLETFTYPPSLHALAVHFPVVLALLGVPLVLLAVLLPKRRGVLWGAVALYAAAAGAGYLALNTGEAAREMVPPTAGADIGALIDGHESWGETVWIAALVTGVLLLLGAVLHERVRLICLLLALASSLATAGITGVTAHRGGRLVYVHGVGTRPFMERLTTPRTAEPAAEAVLEDTPEITGPETQPDAAVPEQPAATLEPEETVDETGEQPVADTATEEEPSATLEPEEAVDEEQPVADTAPVEEPAAVTLAYTYAVHIAPIMTAHCVKCHEAEDPAGDLALATYADLFQEGKKGGLVVAAGDPDGSSLVKYIEGTFQPQMPRKADPLDAETVAVIRRWIAGGAPES